MTAINTLLSKRMQYPSLLSKWLLSILSFQNGCCPQAPFKKSDIPKLHLSQWLLSMHSFYNGCFLHTLLSKSLLSQNNPFTMTAIHPLHSKWMPSTYSCQDDCYTSFLNDCCPQKNFFWNDCSQRMLTRIEWCLLHCGLLCATNPQLENLSLCNTLLSPLVGQSHENYSLLFMS